MFRELNDRAYICGGFVRDEILGLKPQDRDFVIEATEEEFETVFPDAKKVGVSFPVYLHPDTGEEIALTRAEKCTGNGEYQKFDVTKIGIPIIEDLQRRDFTINSIAKHYVTGEILDPTNGVEDLKNKVLRCVNPLAFKDDALRIYRAARFVARFDLAIESQTYFIMFCNSKRLEMIEKERVVIELQKVYAQCEKPSRFFYILHDLHCLHYHFKPLYDLTLVPAGPAPYHSKQLINN